MGGEYKAFSQDLSRGVEVPFETVVGVKANGNERRLSPEDREEFEDVFLWNQGVAGFQPLVTSAAPDTQTKKAKNPAGSSLWVRRLI